MRVVITGGAGFLGTRLAAAILARNTLKDARGVEQPVGEIVLVDVAAADSHGDSRVRVMQGEPG